VNHADYSDVDKLVNGYREAQVVFSAIELGIFDAFAGKPRGLSELADELGVEKRLKNFCRCTLLS